MATSKATSRKTTPVKPAAAKATRKSPASKRTTVPAPVPETPQAEPALNLVMRKKRLLELVVARSHVKKKYAKPVVEAVLEVIGEALANGEDLNLPPLGKIKVQRNIEQARAKVSVVRIRQPHAVTPATKDTLAEAAE